jgi:hypothetical protein
MFNFSACESMLRRRHRHSFRESADGRVASSVQHLRLLDKDVEMIDNEGLSVFATGDFGPFERARGSEMRYDAFIILHVIVKDLDEILQIAKGFRD